LVVTIEDAEKKFAERFEVQGGYGKEERPLYVDCVIDLDGGGRRSRARRRS
jgi:hypothetical protein